MYSVADSIRSARTGARRIISSRPMTTNRPFTSTGLMAPRTARGRTAIRRQVQDKTYWLGMLRSKINELTMEIARLSKESERMAKEESGLSVWQRKAESLARELKNGTKELSIYNEYWDRVRVGQTNQDLKDDIQSIKADNVQLYTKLEKIYEEKKRKEEMIKDCENEIQFIENNLISIKKKFTQEEREQFEKLEELNRSLAIQSDKLEEKIHKWREKKNSIENNEDHNNSLIKKEVLGLLKQLRQLEKQKDDLENDENGGDAKTRILARIKIDIKEISRIETRLKEINQSIDDMSNTIKVYSDKEAVQKFRDLKKKESTMDNFIRDFEKNKRLEIEKLEALGETIQDWVKKCSKYLNYIDLLKSFDQENLKPGSKELISQKDEKRRLEMDLNKMNQLEIKMVAEIESLKEKSKTMSHDIEKYSDIPKLKSEMEEKNRILEEEKSSLFESVQRLKKENLEATKLFEKAKHNLESSELFKKMQNFENKLSQIVAINEEYESKLRSDDIAYIKKQTLEQIYRYNQNLLGF